MPGYHDRRGVRLADVRVPSWYGPYTFMVIVTALVGLLRGRKQMNEAEASMAEAGKLLAERLVDGDKRDDRMAELTESMAAMTVRMEAYGKTSVRLARASLIVAVAALAVAVAAIVAA